MSTTHEQPTAEASPAAIGASKPASYQECDSCGSPLDQSQRYCVVCGTRRKHANDPAARFLSEATKRRRAPASPLAVSSSLRGRRSASFATAALIAMIPAALGAGVLIGRSSGGGDAGLIAALKAQKAPVIQYSGSAPASASGPGTTQSASTPVAAPVSTFKGSSGYAVQLGTLPAGTTQATAAKVQRADRAKGATAVGLISLSQFSVKPKPSSGAYVIYSGDYSSAGAARVALSKLKKSFPNATVISIKSLSASTAATGGKVLTKTRYGTAHQVTSYKPSSAALKQGASVAAKDSHSTGKTASGVGLPDVVAVP